MHVGERGEGSRLEAWMKNEESQVNGRYTITFIYTNQETV